MKNSNKQKIIIFVSFVSLLFYFIYFTDQCRAEDNNAYQGVIIGDDKLTSDTSVKIPDFNRKEIPIDEKEIKLKLNPIEKKSMKIESSGVQLENTVSEKTKVDNEFNNTSSLSGETKTKLDSSTGIKPEKKKKSYKTFLYILGAALLVVLIV